MTSCPTKHCIIIHGCPSDDTDPTYNKHRIPWTKKALEEKEYEVETPLMPRPWAPVYEDYKRVFEQYQLTDKTILVWHSCGCAFLVRWLGESDQKIKKLILVAPWKVNHREDEHKDKFYGYEINKTIPQRLKQITMFTADNEEPAGHESLEIFHKALGGEKVMTKGFGHYTMGDMWTEEFPELIEKIVS